MLKFEIMIYISAC